MKRMITRKRHECSPSGFTLLEMLTVLALLAVMAAVAWPALRSSLRHSRLRDAAKTVRVELAKTRLKAIETGTPQQFRYQPGSGQFEIAPQTSSNDDAPAGKAPTGRRSATPDDWAGDLESLAGDVTRRELPDGVSFSPSPIDEPSSVGATVDSGVGEESWSSPIVFLPNGRTSDARIRLFGEGTFRIDVILRGLTGVAIASELARDEERR
jgi:prepilin-type N-terminal cleavage/methylation domain-containing protein